MWQNGAAHPLNPIVFVVGCVALCLLNGCLPPLPADSRTDSSDDSRADTDTGADSGNAADADGDGWTVAGGDCNDGDALVNPGATEVCDGVDDDCDSLTDDDDPSVSGTTTWYADSDGDGYGASATTTAACSVPADYVADNTDCDDTDVTINPGELEVCNNRLDDDCDGGAGTCGPTSGSLSAADAEYTGEVAGDHAGNVSGAGDVNGDGYADLLVAAGLNDDAGTNAGAAYLVLGSASPGDLDLAAADAKYTGEAPGDLAGQSVSGVGDVNGDGFGDLLVGALYNGDGGSLAGAAYLVLGSSAPRDLSLGRAAAEYAGEAANDQAGYSISGVGDVNGDTYADFVVGAQGNGDGGSYAGAAYLVLGSASPGDLDLGAADAEYTGVAAGDLAGHSVAGAGDVNGDGQADILLGAPFNGANDTGAAYLLLGSAAPGSLGLGAADAAYIGETENDYAGSTVSGVGDANGDGYADFLVGAPYNDAGGTDAGAAYLILGNTSPDDLDLGSADALYVGEAESGIVACSLAGAGDVDGDGYADFLVGADGDADAGAAYLVLGRAAPGALGLADADARYTGAGTDEHAGESVSGVGDVNRDGYADILIGAGYNDDGGVEAGAAYLVLGTGL